MSAYMEFNGLPVSSLEDCLRHGQLVPCLKYWESAYLGPSFEQVRARIEAQAKAYSRQQLPYTHGDWTWRYGQTFPAGGFVQHLRPRLGRLKDLLELLQISLKATPAALQQLLDRLHKIDDQGREFGTMVRTPAVCVASSAFVPPFTVVDKKHVP